MPGLERSAVRSLGLGAALIATLAAAPACFVFGHRTPAPGATIFDVPEGEIALHVTNHNFLDVVIYVLHDGVRTRVATVTGLSATTLYLPDRLLGQGHEIALLGEPIGSQDMARTETLVVQPGQYVDWTLETNLRRSSVAVF